MSENFDINDIKEDKRDGVIEWMRIHPNDSFGEPRNYTALTWWEYLTEEAEIKFADAKHNADIQEQKNKLSSVKDLINFLNEEPETKAEIAKQNYVIEIILPTLLEFVDWYLEESDKHLPKLMKTPGNKWTGSENLFFCPSCTDDWTEEGIPMPWYKMDCDHWTIGAGEFLKSLATSADELI